MGDSDLRVSDFTLVPGGGVSGRVELPSVGGIVADDACDGRETVDASFGSLEFVSKLLPPAYVEQIRATVGSRGSFGSNAIVSVLVVSNPSSGSVQSIAVFLCEDTLRDARITPQAAAEIFPVLADAVADKVVVSTCAGVRVWVMGLSSANSAGANTPAGGSSGNCPGSISGPSEVGGATDGGGT